MSLGDPASDLWLFAQHYPELVKRLTHLRNLSFIRSDLAEALPGVKFEHEESDSWIQMFDQTWWQYTDADKNDTYWWPFYLRVRHIPPEYMTEEEQEESSENLYRVSVVYREKYLKPDIATRVHAAMVARFPELARGRQKANVRRLMMEEVREGSLIAELQRRYRLVIAALQGA
ncbi:hypothetical protein SAMN04487926_1124 [Paraburkholderia steynii]|uniref:Uncharacterized protein n=1 Tax=Paraburkholderia steynii TaxID=1245441 RepID=A0A7Z7FJD2_9BURK|nr:hypothetical protein SAMN04487926_1124 [Paraburkholderia steynii]